MAQVFFPLYTPTHFFFPQVTGTNSTHLPPFRFGSACARFLYLAVFSPCPSPHRKNLVQGRRGKKIKKDQDPFLHSKPSHKHTTLPKRDLLLEPHPPDRNAAVVPTLILAWASKRFLPPLISASRFGSVFFESLSTRGPFGCCRCPQSSNILPTSRRATSTATYSLTSPPHI